MNNAGTKANPEIVPVCHRWSRLGNCRYGDNCRYAHSGSPRKQINAGIGGKPKKHNKKDKAFKASNKVKHQF